LDLLSALRSESPVIAAELRPPRSELAGREGMDAWIDTYHAVRRLTRQGTFVFLTDSAVGADEEDNLRHLIINLGHDVPRERIVPFLTSKHSLEYCLSYADRAHESGFPALVVLGGDKNVGPPRSVEHAWQLRQVLRRRDASLGLGGWANPYSDPDRQVDYLSADDFNGEFYLTQIVSHHRLEPVARFLEASQRRSVNMPGLFGVFYYRSANPRTLQALSSFLPVPVEGLIREFGEGATPQEVCARTIRGLMQLGARHFYVSNLPIARAQQVLADIMQRVAPESARTDVSAISASSRSNPGEGL
jgi:5,10-methylenetetrahydrofolate reductase